MGEPGEPREMRGRRMSNYGVKTYTPEQIKEQWRQSMRVHAYVTTSKGLLSLTEFNELGRSLVAVSQTPFLIAKILPFAKARTFFSVEP